MAGANPFASQLISELILNPFTAKVAENAKKKQHFLVLRGSTSQRFSA